MRRREFIMLIGGATAAWPLAVCAQQPRAPRIGVLAPANLEPFSTEFRGGLCEHGYVEGQNIAFEPPTRPSRPRKSASILAAT
jgi:hypothetical protein